MVISKQVLDAGLTRFYPVIILRDDVQESEVIIDGPDYSRFRINEGMNDQEIMKFAGVV